MAFTLKSLGTWQGTEPELRTSLAPFLRMCSVTGIPVLVLRGTMWCWVGCWDMARGGRDRQTEDDISAENSQLSGELELEANQPSFQYVCRNNTGGKSLQHFLAKHLLSA